MRDERPEWPVSKGAGVKKAGKIKAGVLLLAALFVAVGCGGGDEGAEQGGGAADKGRGDIKISVVTHGQASDPFWSVVKNGVDQALAGRLVSGELGYE